MVKVKTKDVDPKHCYTRTEYAKKKGVTIGRVTQMIDEGKITLVLINGGNIIYDKTD
jgi:hypothetical protein